MQMKGLSFRDLGVFLGLCSLTCFPVWLMLEVYGLYLENNHSKTHTRTPETLSPVST